MPDRLHTCRRGSRRFGTGGISDARPLVLCSLVLCVMAAGCSKVTPPAPVSASYRDPAITYTGAWNVDYGVALAPLGIASVRVSDTTVLSMRAFGKGQVIRVRVDFRAASDIKLKDCKTCMVTVQVAKGLSPAPHAVSIANLDATKPLVIGAWSVDNGGVFRRLATSYKSIHGTFRVGSHVEFYVQNVSSVAIDYVPAGESLEVQVDDRLTGYQVHTVSERPPAERKARTTVAWGLARGVEKIRIDVLAGTLRLQDVVVSQAGGLGPPRILAADVAARAPLLAVYGDSIGNGATTLGFGKNSDGFASRLSALRGWRLADLSVDGASGTCFGKTHVDSVVATHPRFVIVAFGTNDMIAGPDFQGCNATPVEFGSAMAAILKALKAGLPGVPIYVEAIVPSTTIRELTRGVWNAALEKAAAAEKVPVVDPSSVLNLKFDYEDATHPNNRGHAKIAAFWNAHLSPA